MNKEILTQKNLWRLLNYNPDTGIFTRKVALNSNIRIGDIAGGVVNKRAKQYLHIMVDRGVYQAHRLVWLYVHGVWPEEIDHIDGDSLNNKLENLRNVTHAENCKNKRKNRNNMSGITGVRFYKARGKWVSYIYHNKEQIHLGYTYDFFEACCIRKSAENRLGFHCNHGVG